LSPGAGITLGIDTSGTRGSVALYAPGDEAQSRETIFTDGLIHGVALAPAVKELLDGAGLKATDLELVAVGLGPGSYTGVRVGVSFAKALAFAAGLPAIGVSSLDAMAHNAPSGTSVVCTRDARRGTLYVASFDEGPEHLEPAGPICLVKLEDLGLVLPENALVLGDAIEDFADHLSGGGRTFGEPELWHASALTVARLGYHGFRSGSPTDPHELAPIYLRRSEAEERWEEREQGG
jgi:tRNA threonylcarbamoyladenosine biosynthesis protein TsaB